MTVASHAHRSGDTPSDCASRVSSSRASSRYTAIWAALSGTVIRPSKARSCNACSRADVRSSPGAASERRTVVPAGGPGVGWFKLRPLVLGGRGTPKGGTVGLGESTWIARIASHIAIPIWDTAREVHPHNGPVRASDPDGLNGHRHACAASEPMRRSIEESRRRIPHRASTLYRTCRHCRDGKSGHRDNKTNPANWRKGLSEQQDAQQRGDDGLEKCQQRRSRSRYVA